MKIKIFIIHVSTNSQRYEHMEQMLRELKLTWEHEYINEGDLNAITEADLDKYFCNKPDCHMHIFAPATSCHIKHIYAYERIVAQGLDGAIILEDDIILHKDFQEYFNRSMKEYIAQYKDEPTLISYEDSALLFVPSSRKKKGQMLYEGTYDRYAGCYFINRNFCDVTLKDLDKHKTHLPSDGYHNNLRKRGLIRYLWCTPEIATQGSVNGEILSLMSKKSNNMIKLRWFFKYHYRKMLFRLR